MGAIEVMIGGRLGDGAIEVRWESRGDAFLIWAPGRLGPDGRASERERGRYVVCINHTRFTYCEQQVKLIVKNTNYIHKLFLICVKIMQTGIYLCRTSS